MCYANIPTNDMPAQALRAVWATSGTWAYMGWC